MLEVGGIVECLRVGMKLSVFWFVWELVVEVVYDVVVVFVEFGMSWKVYFCELSLF